MKNIRQFFKQASEFQELATIRVNDLLNARGIKYSVTLREFEFYLTSVTIKYIEDSSHPCPDKDEITLTEVELGMDDDYWKEYISAINQKRLDDESNRLKALDKANLEKKKAEFERLKSELGYS